MSETIKPATIDQHPDGHIWIRDGFVPDLRITNVEARTFTLRDSLLELARIFNTHHHHLSLGNVAALVYTAHDIQTGSPDARNHDHAHKTIERERRLREYEICKQRGHQPDNIVLTSNPPQYLCKWCGTRWYTKEAERVEMGAPS